jgi:hypothetical protein
MLEKSTKRLKHKRKWNLGIFDDKTNGNVTEWNLGSPFRGKKPDDNLFCVVESQSVFFAITKEGA